MKGKRSAYKILNGDPEGKKNICEIEA
jgi:hypothetical protein